MTALYQKVLYDTGVPRNVRILEKTESAVFEKCMIWGLISLNRFSQFLKKNYQFTLKKQT